VDAARAELRDELVRSARGVTDKQLLAAVLRFLDEGAVESDAEEDGAGAPGGYSGYGPGSLTGTPSRFGEGGLADGWEVSPPPPAAPPAAPADPRAGFSPPRAPADPRAAKKAFGLAGSTPASVLDDSAPGLFSSPGGAAGGPAPRRFRPRAPAGSASASFAEEESEAAAAAAARGGRPPATYGLAAMGHRGAGPEEGGAPPLPAMHSALGAGLQEEAFYAQRPEAPLAPASLDGLLVPGYRGSGAPGAADAGGAGAAAPAAAGDSDEEDGGFGGGEEGPAFGASEGGSAGGLVRGLAAALGCALRAGAMAGGVAALAVVAAKDREAFSHLASARAVHLGARLSKPLGRAPDALGRAAKALAGASGGAAKALAGASGGAAKALAGASGRAAASLVTQLPRMPAAVAGGVKPTITARSPGPMLSVRTMPAPGGGGPARGGEAPTNAVYETPPPVSGSEWASPASVAAAPAPARAPVVAPRPAAVTTAGGGGRPSALSGMG